MGGSFFRKGSSMEIIARIENDYDTKFGVPRQSGLVEKEISTIVFEPAYRVPEALRGILEFSHLWLIWGFHRAERETWSPTVRPPRLGGNTRVGVFATRSPYRPNGLGLSSVRLLGAEEQTDRGWVLKVGGADLMNGTPIYDIKPYLAYADAHPEATGGFTDRVTRRRLEVTWGRDTRGKLTSAQEEALEEALREDPRPAYQDDPERVYAFEFAGRTVRFRVKDGIVLILYCG